MTYVLAEELIKQIVSDCEEIQQSNESNYTKEQAKISAYNAIAEALNMRKEN